LIADARARAAKSAARFCRFRRYFLHYYFLSLAAATPAPRERRATTLPPARLMPELLFSFASLRHAERLRHHAIFDAPPPCLMMRALPYYAIAASQRHYATRVFAAILYYYFYLIV
jgi:hypothetical protein